MGIVQTAANTTRKQGPGDQGSSSCKVTFTTATTPGSYVLVVVVTAGGIGITHSLSASGFTELIDVDNGDLQLSLWGRANCPSISSITAFTDAYRSMQVRAIELSGIAQASAVDRSSNRSGYSESPTTGTTATTSQAVETVIGVLANQYSTTTQGSFSGGLTKLYEGTSPSSDQDWEQSRYTLHQLQAAATGTFALGGTLSTSRRWLGVVVTLKGGTTGPAKLYSTLQPPLYLVGGNRGSVLSVFGRLRSAAQPAQYLAGIGVRARIGPAAYQMRLGGWTGLLIGAGTDYLIEGVDGLEGWEVRTSDEDLPRDVGALRGPDLQAARTFTIKLNFTGTRQQVEDRFDALKRALVPQRDQDWELIYRLPGQALKSVYCRPTSLVRGMDPDEVLLAHQAIVLRAADPRHYAATISTLTVPITTNRNSPVLVSAYNLGSALAYPIVRVAGGSGTAATRTTLTNTTTGQKFDVATVLGAGSTLTGDMRSRVAGLPVSAVTVDDQAKYGAWQPPRVPFALAPGINQLMFEVEPADAGSVCSLEWRSTWSG